MRTGLLVWVTTELVSRPYVDMTVAVMEAFGVTVERPDESTWVVEPQTYRATTYAIEPDASAARSEEHTSELQSLMRSSYAVFCLQKKNNNISMNSLLTIHTSTPSHE